MVNVALHTDPLDELRLVAPVVPDRLPAMLFLAALVHGILIIGITFNTEITNPFANAISLEVTIVADADQQIPRGSSSFKDSVHFSTLGHKQMADILAKEIDALAQSSLTQLRIDPVNAIQ